MPLRRTLGAVALLALTACQAPAPAAPTSVPPTSVPRIATAPPVGTARIDTLKAANSAFQSGDVVSAQMLYERVLNTPPTGEPATTTAAINELAHFRAMVTLLADGREDDAHAHLDALQQSNANAPLARLGAQLWDQYGMVGQLRGACAQLQPQIASQAGPTLATLQSLGVTIDPQTLCTVPNH